MFSVYDTPKLFQLLLSAAIRSIQPDVPCSNHSTVGLRYTPASLYITFVEVISAIIFHMTEVVSGKFQYALYVQIFFIPYSADNPLLLVHLPDLCSQLGLPDILAKYDSRYIRP